MAKSKEQLLLDKIWNITCEDLYAKDMIKDIGEVLDEYFLPKYIGNTVSLSGFTEEEQEWIKSQTRVINQKVTKNPNYIVNK
jgi:hypothetical protein